MVCVWLAWADATGLHAPPTRLFVCDLHLARAQRLGHLARSEQAIAVGVKLGKDVAQRVSILARRNALPCQQLQNTKGKVEVD